MAHRSLDLPSVPGLAPGRGWGQRLADGVLPWLAARLLEERERWLLWLPVGLGAGIGVYFALPSEPPLWLGPTLLLPVLLAGGWPRGAPAPGLWRPALLLALAAAACGLAVATLRMVTPAQASSACSSMSPEQASRPSPPV